MSYGDVEIRSNSKYLKIESGTPHDIRLLSESPKCSMVHGFGPEKIDCIGPVCFKCAAGDEVKQRFSAQVWDWTVKRRLEWEFGAAIAKQLKSIDQTLAEEGKQITEVDLKVEAEGSNMQKKYRVTPRMTSKPLPPEAELQF
jgi:hypothetical protein